MKDVDLDDLDLFKNFRLVEKPKKTEEESENTLPSDQKTTSDNKNKNNQNKVSVGGKGEKLNAFQREKLMATINKIEKPPTSGIKHMSMYIYNL